MFCWLKTKFRKLPLLPPLLILQGLSGLCAYGVVASNITAIVISYLGMTVVYYQMGRINEDYTYFRDLVELMESSDED